MILAHGQEKIKKKKGAPVQKVPYPLKPNVIDRIIYPVYTKKGLKFGKPKRQVPKEPTEESLQTAEPVGKLLDGFLILYSCRVKLPHEAIKSKLASHACAAPAIYNSGTIAWQNKYLHGFCYGLKILF